MEDAQTSLCGAARGIKHEYSVKHLDFVSPGAQTAPRPPPLRDSSPWEEPGRIPTAIPPSRRQERGQGWSLRGFSLPGLRGGAGGGEGAQVGHFPGVWGWERSGLRFCFGEKGQTRTGGFGSHSAAPAPQKETKRRKRSGAEAGERRKNLGGPGMTKKNRIKQNPPESGMTPHPTPKRGERWGWKRSAAIAAPGLRQGGDEKRQEEPGRALCSPASDLFKGSTKNAL